LLGGTKAGRRDARARQESEIMLGKQHPAGCFQNKHDTTEEMGSLTTEF